MRGVAHTVSQMQGHIEKVDVYLHRGVSPHDRQRTVASRVCLSRIRHHVLRAHLSATMMGETPIGRMHKSSVLNLL